MELVDCKKWSDVFNDHMWSTNKDIQGFFDAMFIDKNNIPVCSKQMRQVSTGDLEVFESKGSLRVHQEDPQGHCGNTDALLCKGNNIWNINVHLLYVRGDTMCVEVKEERKWKY